MTAYFFLYFISLTFVSFEKILKILGMLLNYFIIITIIFSDYHPRVYVMAANRNYTLNICSLTPGSGLCVQKSFTCRNMKSFLTVWSELVKKFLEILFWSLLTQFFRWNFSSPQLVTAPGHSDFYIYVCTQDTLFSLRKKLADLASCMICEAKCNVLFSIIIQSSFSIRDLSRFPLQPQCFFLSIIHLYIHILCERKFRALHFKKLSCFA